MLGTVVGTIVMCVAQGWILRDTLGGIEGARLVSATARMLIAAALMGAAAYGAWYGLDELMGGSLVAQLVEVLVALAVGVGRLRRGGVGAAGARGAPDPRAAR